MSSVFFEYPTDLASRVKGEITDTAWANGEQNILATATKNGDITMYLEEVNTNKQRERHETDKQTHRHRANI